MSVTVSIRRATPADAEAVLGCLRSAFAPYRESYTPDAYLNTVPTSEGIHERFASLSVLVAVTAAGTVVGTISHQITGDDEGHLRGMAVLPEYLGAGVAAQLLAAAERELQYQGCSRVSLETTVPLRRAVRFYEKHGFRFSGRATDFFGMSLLEYVKELRRT